MGTNFLIIVQCCSLSQHEVWELRPALRWVPLWLHNDVSNLYVGPQFKECLRGEVNESLAAIYRKSAFMTNYFFAIRYRMHAHFQGTFQHKQTKNSIINNDSSNSNYMYRRTVRLQAHSYWNVYTFKMILWFHLHELRYAHYIGCPLYQ